MQRGDYYLIISSRTRTFFVGFSSTAHLPSPEFIFNLFRCCTKQQLGGRLDRSKTDWQPIKRYTTTRRSHCDSYFNTSATAAEFVASIRIFWFHIIKNGPSKISHVALPFNHREVECHKYQTPSSQFRNSKFKIICKFVHRNYIHLCNFFQISNLVLFLHRKFNKDTNQNSYIRYFTCLNACCWLSRCFSLFHYQTIRILTFSVASKHRLVIEAQIDST